MPRRALLWPLACALACGSKPEEKKVEPAAAAPEGAAASPDAATKAEPAPPARVSRPDEYFWITLAGPAFAEPQKFEFEPDSVRANVISTRSAIQYVRQGQTPVRSADGSRIIMLQAQFGGAAPGEYAHEPQKRTFVVTLGVETSSRESATLQARSGKLVAETVSREPRELKGTFEGELGRTNKGKEGEAYKITGAFNLAE